MKIRRDWWWPPLTLGLILLAAWLADHDHKALAIASLVLSLCLIVGYIAWCAGWLKFAFGEGFVALKFIWGGCIRMLSVGFDGKPWQGGPHGPHWWGYSVATQNGVHYRTWFFVLGTWTIATAEEDPDQPQKVSEQT